jgi:hypothetical protein
VRTSDIRPEITQVIRTEGSSATLALKVHPSISFEFPPRLEAHGNVWVLKTKATTKALYRCEHFR